MQRPSLHIDEEMVVASNWYKENLLKANLDKYQTMTLKPKLKEQTNDNYNTVSLHIDGHQITTTQDLRILGVNMDDLLIFSKHIITVCKKSSQRVGVILRLRKLIQHSLNYSYTS